MEQFIYQTLTIDARKITEPSPDEEIGRQLEEQLSGGWAFVNGPTVTDAGVYVFLLSKPRPSDATLTIA